MKHLGSLIKNQIETNKLTKRAVADAVGISPNYLSTLFKQSTMDCELFEKLCYAIGLNPAIAFDSHVSTSKSFSDISANTVIGSANVNVGENNALRELIASKDAIIAEKERVIQLLISGQNRDNYNI